MVGTPVEGIVITAVATCLGARAVMDYLRGVYPWEKLRAEVTLWLLVFVGWLVWTLVLAAAFD